MQKDDKKAWGDKLFSSTAKNSKKLWAAVRAVNGEGVDNTPSTLIVDDVMITKPTEIAEALNNFFIEKVEKLVAKLPPKVVDL